MKIGLNRENPKESDGCSVISEWTSVRRDIEYSRHINFAFRGSFTISTVTYPKIAIIKGNRV